MAPDENAANVARVITANTAVRTHATSTGLNVSTEYLNVREGVRMPSLPCRLIRMSTSLVRTR